ncbi:DUF3891 family protein [Lentibacillus halophilus]|uniref:DUF3891 family protein n=1 Tax=Lentibacillus halophilus TaxID=295065 RepID=A0ABP3IX08_9BACI
MIVRERPNDFVMIEQDNHAQASGDMMIQWKNDLFPGLHWRPSVEHAIRQHDVGWKSFDQQPFWNDQKQAPYTFIDFPPIPKTILYKQGIDEVERDDTYAAILCSEHYKGFMEQEQGEAAREFVQQEEQRQQRLMTMLKDWNSTWFHNHYAFLQLADSLSLYACLNEPGVSKEQEHPFFKDGIPLSAKLDGISHSKIKAHWLDQQTVALEPFPFHQPVDIALPQKIVSKKDIDAKGLIKSYENTPFHNIHLRLTAQ